MQVLFCLKQTVRYYINRKTVVCACFLDLSKAFDSVDYEILWNVSLKYLGHIITDDLKDDFDVERERMALGV